MNKITWAVALLFLFITGWEEESKKKPGTFLFKSWRKIQFDVLSPLEQRNLIRTSWDSQSLELTEEGKWKAKQLKTGLERLIEELMGPIL